MRVYFSASFFETSANISSVLLRYYQERMERMDIDPPYDENTFTGYGDDNFTGRLVFSDRIVLEWAGEYAEPGSYESKNDGADGAEPIYVS